jgi:hypothetical protein
LHQGGQALFQGDVQMIEMPCGLPQGVVDPKHALIVIKELVQLIAERALHGIVGIEAQVESPATGMPREGPASGVHVGWIARCAVARAKLDARELRHPLNQAQQRDALRL